MHFASFHCLQREDTLQFLVSIRDRVNASGDSENDNVVQVPITVIVLDDNDNPPEFQNVSRIICPPSSHSALLLLTVSSRLIPGWTLFL